MPSATITGECLDEGQPNNPLAWYYLRNNYATGLQQPDAATNIPTGRAARPESAWRLANLGVQFMKVKRYEDAVRAFKRATELEPRKPNIGTTSPPPTGRLASSISRWLRSTTT